MPFFGLTPLTKSNFYKIHRLRCKDAVFTVAKEMLGRMFFATEIFSLSRTVSAQFKLKVKFWQFFTDPPWSEGPWMHFPNGP
jgi:hypothetical protein